MAAFADERLKQRTVIEFLVLQGIKQNDIVKRLNDAYKDESVSRATASRWIKRINSKIRAKDSNEEDSQLCQLTDERRSGRPRSAFTTDNKSKAAKLIKENRKISLVQLSSMLGVSKGSAHKIVESLGNHKVCAKWEPKQLTENQKRARVQCCRELRQMCESDQTFFERIVTGDETWIHYYEPETKQQSMEWRHPSSPKPKKFRCERSANKLLAVVFWDIHGVILIVFLPRGETMNSDRYIETLKKLKKRISRKRPDLPIERVLFHHDNAPCHTSVQTRETIASIGWTTLPHPPYSPDLAQSDYHLFGPLKFSLRGINHNNDNEVKKAVKSWLINQPQEFYRRGIESLSQRWIKAITRQGQFVED